MNERRGAGFLRVASALTLATTLAAKSAQDFTSDVLVLPQREAFGMSTRSTVGAGVELTAVDAQVVIEGRRATTRLLLSLRNATSSALDAELIMPIPDEAFVREFDFLGASEKPTATLLERHEARALYWSIVNRLQDPALLEFASSRTLRSSVFPVPAGGEQRLAIAYDELLPRAPDGRIDYRLPRSDVRRHGGARWSITVRIDAGEPIRTVYSPSHEIRTARLSPSRPVVELIPEAAEVPGDFRLAFVPGGTSGPLASTFITAPDPDEAGGWFAMITDVPPAEARLSREVTLVLDRSGSMRGEKMEQAREAALQILEGLRPGEAFNILDYATDVRSFAPAPVARIEAHMADARDYLRAVSVGGSTNLSEALLTAVQQPLTEGRLPMVLFLTDGVPTHGLLDEATIRTRVADANTGGRRVFTFGVGTDVNAPLLDQIALSTRATSTFVLPDEDVEVKVGEVYERLFGPVLADVELSVLDADGVPDPYAFRDLTPAPMPDLYEGDELVLVGRYLRDAPCTVVVEGRTAAGATRIERCFDPSASAIADDVFVRRLWAQRRVASLIDEVRQLGSSGAAGEVAVEPAEELIQEIVLLSTTYGILTEYTAFMATEGTDIRNTSALRKRVRSVLASRARQQRTGGGAVSQSMNIARMRHAHRARRTTAFLDKSLKSVEIAAVHQVADLTFFRFGERWVDARILRREQAAREAATELGGPDARPPKRSALQIFGFGTDGYAVVASALGSEGRAAILTLSGDVFTLFKDEPVLLRQPAPVDS